MAGPSGLRGTRRVLGSPRVPKAHDLTSPSPRVPLSSCRGVIQGPCLCWGWKGLPRIPLGWWPSPSRYRAGGPTADPAPAEGPLCRHDGASTGKKVALVRQAPAAPRSPRSTRRVEASGLGSVVSAERLGLPRAGPRLPQGGGDCGPALSLPLLSSLGLGRLWLWQHTLPRQGTIVGSGGWREAVGCTPPPGGTQCRLRGRGAPPSHCAGSGPSSAASSPTCRLSGSPGDVAGK